MQNILIVGQCNYDFQQISSTISQMYDVEIHRADLFDDAIQSALEQSYALILINRIIDRDQSEWQSFMS